MKYANENAWNDTIASEAAAAGIEPAFVKAIIGAESNFIPGATHQDAAGNFSAGLMQVENTTFDELDYAGEQGNAADLTGYWNPTTNIHYGVRLLADLQNQLGFDLPGIASAYNGGVRPEIGFSKPADHQLTICLQRNPDGSCARTKLVQPGEYANQDYVVKVLSLLTYFRQQDGTATPQQSGGGGLVPGASITFTPSILTVAIVIGVLWWILSPKGRSA